MALFGWLFDPAWLRNHPLWYVWHMESEKFPSNGFSSHTDAVPDRDIIQAEVVADDALGQFRTIAETPPKPRRRRIRLPLILFSLTCISTFFVGAMHWLPGYYFEKMFSSSGAMPMRQMLIAHWQDGLIYMACVLAILLTHEMGHFFATLWHRIPASFPYCIPIPITPFGTMGAVIGMDGMRADRKQMFDIGIAGPLAGLVVTIPIMWIGINQLDLSAEPHGGFTLESPLVVHWALEYIQPNGYQEGVKIWNGHNNPYYMAGWVGLLITSLNLLPVSQLDGGHIAYTLLGKKAHLIARGLIVAAIAWSIYSLAPTWGLMIVLVLFIGTDHPPTRDDSVPLGWFRTTLGYATLLIPILCFTPEALMIGS